MGEGEGHRRGRGTEGGGGIQEGEGHRRWEEGHRRWRRDTGGGGAQVEEGHKRGLHAVMLLYLFLSSLSVSLLASDEYHGELLMIH